LLVPVLPKFLLNLRGFVVPTEVSQIDGQFAGGYQRVRRVPGSILARPNIQCRIGFGWLTVSLDGSVFACYQA
jgi:hypothetical protein